MKLYNELATTNIEDIFVCYGNEINEHSIFAIIEKETVFGVKVKRFTKYGKINIYTVSFKRSNFEKYYKRLIYTPDYIKDAIRHDRSIERGL